jgi:hypothetical protein
MISPAQNPASYRDPSGFVFFADGRYYRQVNVSYAKHYDQLINSGLYDELTGKKYLLKHTEIEPGALAMQKCYKTLLPEQLTTISYPFEWCFDQLKDAALLTLDIVKLSMDRRMILKDATPYNIQFRNGMPIFIDTISFEAYDESQPWIAYRQFCEIFLFPLLIAHYQKENICPLLYGYPDGVPVNTTVKHLPFKSRFNPSVWMHVFLQNRVSSGHFKSKSSAFSKKKLLLLVDHLYGMIKHLSNDRKTTWNDYYGSTIISGGYLSEKERIITNMLDELTGNLLLDIGANDGYFSLLAAKKFDVISIDNDEECIKSLYRKIKEDKKPNILPLCINISNPTPATGFASKERTSFLERIRPDAVLALALIHHLALTNNIPLPMIADYLSQFSPQLIIEFVPKDDEKSLLLLRDKKDIFPDYTMDNFEKIFLEKFNIEKKEQIKGTNRYLYLMKRNNTGL